MTTQTGSISFESVGGFSSHAKNNYATLSQIKGQFATCGTGVSTAEKEATIVPTDSGWTLYNGATITVKFTSKNTAANPTLNVNGTGAKPIKDYAGNALTSDAYNWPAGAAMSFTYDGTSWRLQDSNLMERVHSAETSIDQTATSITSLAILEDTYTKPDGTTGTNSIKSQFTQTANAINAKVDKNGVIASINASVEEENGSQIKISADKVNITGTAIFSALGSANKVVTSTQTQWYSSTSATTKTDGSWGTTQPTVTAGRYIWERQYITYSNGDTEYKPSEAGVCVQGQTDLSSYSTTAQANNLYDAKGAANTVNNTLTDYMSTTNSTLQSLQNQVDGQIEAWFFDVDPAETSYTAAATPTDSAASTWTTAEIKERHIGDLYYNTVSGHSWRWMKDGNNYKWLAIPDSDAAAALAKANAAQATANSKRRIFTAQPTTPYDKGDLWVNGDTVKYCGTARASGNYNASDWVLTATDDTLAQTAKDIANAANATEQTLYYASNSTTTPAIPTAQITTNSTSTYGAWNLALPTYSATYPYLYTCLQRKTAGGTYSWTGAMQSSYAAWTSAINTTANNAAPKTSAVSRTQRIYYQSASTTPPTTPGTASSNWVLDESGAPDKWTLKRMSYSSAKPYIYTCEQKQVVSGTVSYTPVLLDDTTTVIDGGKIITGSIAANSINANSGTFNTANIPNLSADKITSGSISADRIKANVISAVNGGTGTINGDKIKASSINIGSLAGEIGGRNLVIDSKNFRVGSVQSSSTMNQTTENGMYKMVISAGNTSNWNSGWWPNKDSNWSNVEANLKTGDPFVISFRIKATGSTVKPTIYIKPGLGYYSMIGTLSSDWSTIYYVGTWNDSETINPHLGWSSVSTASTYYIESVKLEKGSKPTDWTPAPEDVDFAIDNASKVASNYIHADSSGIRIASANPSTATTYQHQTASATEFYVSSKKRSQVDANGLEIFDTDGSTSLAKFGSELRVGKVAAPRVEVIPNSGVYVFGGTIELYAGNNTSASQKTSISSSGIFNYYNSNNYTKQASDGFYVYEGGSLRTKIGSGTIDLYAGAQTYPKTSLSSSGVFNYYDSTHYSKIDSNGLTVYSGDASRDVASFGATARLGKTNSSRFLMNADSLQGYNSSNKLYFEVSSSGIKYGTDLSATGTTNTVATTTQVSESNNAANTVVTVYPVTIDYAAGTAILAVKCMRGTEAITPSDYLWTKGTSTTSIGTRSILQVTDLNTIYNCTVTISV